jgi:two-component sensor histidine kinase/PAS domain-containing protein
MLIAGFAIVALIFAAGVFVIDRRAVLKQEQLFNDHQFVQTFLVSQALAGNIEHLQLYPDEISKNAIPDFLRGFRSKSSIDYMFAHKGDSFQDYISEIYFDRAGNIVFSYLAKKTAKKDIIDISRKYSADAHESMYSGDFKPPYFSPIFFYNDLPAIGMTYPVYLNGIHQGDLVSIISLNRLISRYVESMKSGRTGQAFLYDDTGTIIFHHRPSFIRTNIFNLKIDKHDNFQDFVRESLSNLSGKSSYRYFDNIESKSVKRKLAVWNTIKTGDRRMILALSAPDEDIEEGLSDLRMQRTLLSILLISMFAAFIITASYHRHKLLVENARALENLVNKKSEELSAKEIRYRTIFEESPISLLEFDLSRVKEFIDKFERHNTLPIETFLTLDSPIVHEIISRIMIVDANKTSLQMFGFESKRDFLESFPMDESSDIQSSLIIGISRMKQNLFTTELETVFNLKNGKTIFARLFGTIVPGHEKKWSQILISITDITKIKNSEERLLISLSEKETLLRELYHRTKNNMQVICSMLALQSATNCNEDLRSAFRQMENKIHSMALVHQKLYQSQNLSSINLRDYVHELVLHIISSYEIYTGKIKTNLDIENISVLLDIAIPFGLIISELISNSMKYAFPGKDSGEIDITLHREEDDTITLIVADNGIGPPPQFDVRENGRMGMKSVIALAELQLQGSYSVSDVNGFVNRVSFKDRLYKERI